MSRVFTFIVKLHSIIAYYLEIEKQNKHWKCCNSVKSQTELNCEIINGFVWTECDRVARKGQNHSQ